MKNFLKPLVFFLFLFCLFVSPLAAGTLHVTDMAGREVKVPSDPGRIICLGPGALRLIVYLEAAGKVVGVEALESRESTGRPYIMAHPELAGLPHVGPGGPGSINKKPDMEAVLKVIPELIFATYMEPEQASEIQRIIGIPVVVLSYGKTSAVDDVLYNSLRLAGKILNRDQRAEAIIAYIGSLKAELAQRTADIPEDRKPSVYAGGIGNRGTQGIDSTDRSWFPLVWSHTRNIAEDVEARIGTHVFMDREMLLRLNPDVIFIDGSGLEMVRQDFLKKPEYYRALKAFQTGRVYSLFPFNWYTTNIDTALADAVAVAATLYPESFQDMDPEKKADDIYRFFNGKPVYKLMHERYGKIGHPVGWVNQE